MEDIFVPIALFGSIALIVWAVGHHRAKAAVETNKVLTAMVDKGEPLTPEVIRALGVRSRPRNADLRTGLVLVAIALATFFFATLIPDDEGTVVMSGIGMFPFLIGLVYTGLWFFVTRKDEI